MGTYKGGTRKITLDRETNALRIEQALAIANLPRIDIMDAEALEARVQEYFNLCIEREMRPGMAGLSLALGLPRQTLINWAKGANCSPDQQAVAGRARQTLETLLEMYMMNDEINVAAGIFLGSNHYGLEQKSTREIELAPSIVTTATPEQLEKRYQHDIIDVDAHVTPERKSIETGKTVNVPQKPISGSVSIESIVAEEIIEK